MVVIYIFVQKNTLRRLQLPMVQNQIMQSGIHLQEVLSGEAIGVLQQDIELMMLSNTVDKFMFVTQDTLPRQALHLVQKRINQVGITYTKVLNTKVTGQLQQDIKLMIQLSMVETFGFVLHSILQQLHLPLMKVTGQYLFQVQNLKTVGKIM